MCILSHPSPAARLDASARLRLALDALSGLPVTQLAADNLVSRKFVYQQLDRAAAGLQMAFEPPDQPDGLLFWLPVTKPSRAKNSLIDRKPIQSSIARQFRLTRNPRKSCGPGQL